jgi:hypothetical protein
MIFDGLCNANNISPESHKCQDESHTNTVRANVMSGLGIIASSTICNNPSFSFPKDRGSRFLRNADNNLKATGRLYLHRPSSLSVKHHVENDKFIVFIYLKL